MDKAKGKASPQQQADVKEFLKLLGDYDKAKKEADQGMSGGLAAALIVLLVPLSITLGLAVIGVDAFMLMILWKWFVADLFKVQLNYLAAFGITLVMSMYTYEKPEHKTWKDVIIYFLGNIFRPMIYLGIGYLALKFLA